jgi:glutaminyl-peptide cyclotransferase
MRWRFLTVTILMLGSFLACSSAPGSTTRAPGAEDTASAPAASDYEVVAEYPHDPEAFTQGLAWHGSKLFESTGLNGSSSLREVDLETGEVKRKIDLEEVYFAEGMTTFRKRVYQLTWQSEQAFVYKPKSFEQVKILNYKGEGWGLTHNRTRLIMSNGSDVLAFRKAGTFKVTRELHVTENGRPVHALNELEWINGEIFANVWQTDDIIRIDPQSGEVLDRINFAELHEKESSEGEPDVLNGIAYLKSQDRLFITGKWWAHVYEIELAES